MATNSIKECPVCEEDFNETYRCPRTLPCSHYLCSDCINRMIQNNRKVCPFCRSSFAANSSNDIIINRAAIDFLRYLKERSPSYVSESPLSKRIAQMEKETGEIRACLELYWEEAKVEVLRLTESINILFKDLQMQNVQVDKEILPMIVKIKDLNKKKQENLKIINTRLSDRLLEINEKQTKLQDAKIRIDRANTFTETAVLMDEVEVLKEAVGEWSEYWKSLVNEDKNMLQSIAENIKETKDKTVKTQNVLKQIWGETSGTTRLMPQRQEPIAHEHVTLDELQRLSDPIKTLVEQGKVYAMKLQRGPRFAKLSIQDQKLRLHHLDTKRPPEDAYVFDHHLLLNLTNPSSRVAFLDLGVNGSSIGNIYIQLSPDTDGARQFAMLCTGEMGPSYANSRALVVADKGRIGEHVRFGDYEQNNGKGGKSLVPGLCSKGEYQRPDVDGIVAGNGWATQNETISAQFNIRTRSRPGKNCKSAFAQVVENLHVLKDIIQQYNTIRNVSIIDCGLVLPRSLSSE